MPVTTEKIGRTPLIEVDGIYAKLECTNPAGSVKDRIAQYIIDESERRGLLKPGMTIVEATSGNTGIALTYYARQKGYNVIIVMPENMTAERKQLIEGFGAQLILCSAAGSFQEAAAIRDRLAKEHGYFNPDQFSNPLNVECHQKTTGQELLQQLPNSVVSIDAFVAGVGTGGTLIGVGHALRAVYPKVHIVAVEPSESAVMSGGSAGNHGIGGIGDGFIPAIAAGDRHGKLHAMIDEVICISTADALRAAQDLEQRCGFCIGVSAGANFLAAKQLHQRFQTVVTIFSDGYMKYLTQGLEQSQPGRCEHGRTCSKALRNN